MALSGHAGPSQAAARSATLRFISRMPLLPSPTPIEPGVLLRHYKGGLYRVTGLCRIEATLETGVLYQALQGDTATTWLRPLSQFHESVPGEAGPVPRFLVSADPAAGQGNDNGAT